ncbi:basic phospholipase A2 homolog 1-like [Scyliorhinus canicula]|uniref:basic phospholipase A2 homolog 1-like n=1 Tax=Scyliorhinus canicula TaxID=7830 RepID=UPI0018F7AAC6|nr:basic phospholipase A2 homolog 1-like [Scyliorhinus canicula]
MRQTSITRMKQEVMESAKLTAILVVLFAIWIPAQRAESINYRTVVFCANPGFRDEPHLDYGCVCGHRGNGNQPLDDFDRCCKAHEGCYDEGKKMGCTLEESWYSSECDNGFPRCGRLFVPYVKPECSTKACLCDVQAALCFKEKSHTFNREFVHYDQSLCKTVP